MTRSFYNIAKTIVLPLSLFFSVSCAERNAVRDGALNRHVESLYAECGEPVFLGSLDGAVGCVISVEDEKEGALITISLDKTLGFGISSLVRDEEKNGIRLIPGKNAVREYALIKVHVKEKAEAPREK